MARSVIPRPSAANRWASFNGCPGSVQLESHYPDEETDSAIEGTAAHELLEMVMTSNIDAFDMVDKPTANGLFFTEEMAVAVTETFNHVMAIAPLHEWHVEEYVNIDMVLFGHGGTPDLWHYNPNTETLTIPDLKFGWGIVEAFENWQLLDYAVGIYYHLLKHNNMISKIDLIIHQPRPHHPDGKFRMWSLTVEQLQPYFEQLKFAANSTADYITTGAHCRHCTAMQGCPAGRLAVLSIVAFAYKPMIEEYTDEGLSNEKDIIDIGMKILKQRSESIDGLIEERINDGHIVPGYGFERSTARRKWLPGATEKLKAYSLLYAKPLTKEAPITPTQAKKLGMSESLINEMSIIPETGLKLIKRNATETAQRTFGDVK